MNEYYQWELVLTAPQEVMQLLEKQQTLSPSGGLLHALAKIQYTDLDIISGQQVTSVLKAYHETQNILLEQVQYVFIYFHESIV